MNSFQNIFISYKKLLKCNFIYYNKINFLYSQSCQDSLKFELQLNTLKCNIFNKFYVSFIKISKKKFLKILILILKTKFLKNGHRFKQLQYNFIPFKNSLFFFLKKKNFLKNFTHRKRNQKILHYPQFKYNTLFPKNLFWLIQIFKFKYTYIALSKTTLGSKIITPLIDTLSFGNTFSIYKNIWKFIFFTNIGNIYMLKYTLVWCIVSQVGFNKSLFIKSFGTYGIILNQYDFFTKIQLPSGSKKIFNNLNMCFVGRNAGKLHYKEYFGKASFNLNNKSIKTRSIAKNPIDHPNGGRTPGKSPKKTPWGLIAKKNK